MYRTRAIERLRKELENRDLQAIIIPTGDPHFGEYTQDYYKIREWLSGFTGSAGTLVVTLDKAALWTDSRYFVQAAQELQGVEIALMKIKMEGTPTISQWLKSVCNGEFRVAIDEQLFSYGEYCSLLGELAPEGAVEALPDLFADIWDERKKLVFNPVEYLPVEYSGEESISKYERLREILSASLPNYNGQSEIPGFAYIVTACDEVAWLCNIRGCDIEYNPLPQSYAVVSERGVELFVKREALSAAVADALASQKITLHDYYDYPSFLQGIPPESIRICSKSKITVRDYRLLDCAGARFADDPVVGGALNRMKAVKNGVELEGFRRAFLYDGVAWCRLLCHIDSELQSGATLDEYSIGEKLISFREELDGYRGESFEPIVAFGPNAALPHYSAAPDKSASFSLAGSQRGKGTLLLMDTGAQFTFGTTDTTRTIPIGETPAEMNKFYTLVLKGMISLSEAKFPKGTRGASLDILARGPLFNEAVMYYHGTSHGIGHYLSVHEGPQSVRMEENPVTLEPGMVISNEPAIYFADRFGIRTENVISVEPWLESEFNRFYRFATYTLVPISTKPVVKELLTPSEIEWLNSYNKNVCVKIRPLLENENERNWLQKATAAI